MNIEKALLSPSHLQKEEAERIAREAATARKSFVHLLHLMSAENITLCKRAAWCFSLAAEMRPDWINNCQASLVANLAIAHPPDALLRNTLRILRDCTIHRELYEQLSYHCFELVQDPHKAIAIRAFALYILGQIATAVPELRPEVRAIIDYYFDENTAPQPGLRTAARNVLKAWAEQPS